METITIGDKTYISSKQAAKITGYAKDYVGQLCREGRVEARLVGRSWYVLEDSIKEHRFGVQEKDLTEAPEPAPAQEKKEVTETWKQPRYQPQETTLIPELKERSNEPQKLEGNAAVADMQSAWKEWFEEKQSPALPDGKDDFKEELLPVPSSSFQELDPEAEQQVSISRIPEETSLDKEAEESSVRIERVATKTREEVEKSETTGTHVVDLSKTRGSRLDSKGGLASRKQKTSVIVTSLLIAAAAISASIAIVGTGYGDSYISANLGETSVQNSIYEYLVGKSTLIKP